MSGHNLIKVIKRAERVRLERQAAGCTNPELSAPEKAIAQAATVQEWINEFQQTRLARRQEIQQQFGWSQDEGNGSKNQKVRASRNGEEEPTT